MGEIIESHHQSGCWARIHLQSPILVSTASLIGAEIEVQHRGRAGRSTLGYPQCPKILLFFEALGQLQGLPVASHC